MEHVFKIYTFYSKCLIIFVVSNDSTIPLLAIQVSLLTINFSKDNICE